MSRFAFAALLSCLPGHAKAGECQSKVCEESSDPTSMLQTWKTADVGAPAPTPPCPYNFQPPNCSDAEVQTPRDLLPGAPGDLVPKAATLDNFQTEFQPLTNVHFHLGAEHRSEAYRDGRDSEAYDASSNPSGTRPGFMCKAAHKSCRRPYKFKYCKEHVEVGKTYEIHYVHSSAGLSDEDLDDGLLVAANGRGLLNPVIAVDAQVVQIVNGRWSKDDFDIKWNKWTPNRKTSVMYPGSTTGTSYNNSICSPYSITWHVDKSCYKITAKSFDRFCKELAENGVEKDLNAHGSRILVKPDYVAKPEFVVPLA